MWSTVLLFLTVLACGASSGINAAAVIRSVQPEHEADASSHATAPWFCHDLECPAFNVEDKDVGGGMELRTYEAGVWMSTNVSDVGYDEAVSLGFMRLFHYISGANADNRKIDMTAPVRARLIPGDGPFCESHFTISFFVPPELQDEPPAPTDPHVFVDPSPACSFYVAAYTGFANEKRILEHAFASIEMLRRAGRDFDASMFYAAGYDSPFRLLDRHNEVWITALDRQASA